eukprot:2426993-Prorocentrum_lima.AAC.1
MDARKRCEKGVRGWVGARICSVITNAMAQPANDFERQRVRGHTALPLGPWWRSASTLLLSS